MRTGAATLACGIVLGAAAGFVGGHLSAWTRLAAQPVPTVAAFAPHPDSPWDAVRPASPVETAHTVTTLAADDEPVYFPDPAPSASATVHAEALETVSPSDRSHVTTEEPAALPQATAASPLVNDANPDDAHLRQLIDAELSDLPVQAREVWLEVLRGLPPDDAIGIVRLWRRFGGPPPSDEIPVVPQIVSRGPEKPVSPSAPATSTTPGPAQNAAAAADIDRSLLSLQQARWITLNNLLNAETYGFRRREVNCGEAPPHPADGGHRAESAARRSAAWGLCVCALGIDFRTGSYVSTDSPLHLAIQGSGFFVVTDGQQMFLTRCGRFARDEDGCVALETSRGRLRLDPPVSIPSDGRDVAVSGNGEFSVVAPGDAGRIVCGSLQLAVVADMRGLRPQGDALFVVTPASGELQRLDPEANLPGIVLSRTLEQSNVDVAVEQERLKRLDDLWQKISAARLLESR